MSHHTKAMPDYSVLSPAKLSTKSNKILQLIHENPQKVIKAMIDALLGAHGKKSSKTKQELIKFLVAVTAADTKAAPSIHGTGRPEGEEEAGGEEKAKADEEGRSDEEEEEEGGGEDKEEDSDEEEKEGRGEEEEEAEEGAGVEEVQGGEEAMELEEKEVTVTRKKKQQRSLPVYILNEEEEEDLKSKLCKQPKLCPYVEGSLEKQRQKAVELLAWSETALGMYAFILCNCMVC